MKRIEPKPKPENREVVLYVEDNAVNREVAEARLGARYDLVLATTDLEAIQIVEEYGEKLSVILMDIELRGSTLNGIDLTKLLRGTLPQVPTFAQTVRPLSVPIIFVSAFQARYSEPYLVGLGGDALIPKPVDFLSLTQAITKLTLQRIQRRMGTSQ